MPVIFSEAVLMVVFPAASVVRFANACVPPITPLKVVSGEFTVRSFVSPEALSMAARLTDVVPVSVTSVSRMRLSFTSITVALTLPALMVVLPAASVVKVSRAMPAPTLPSNRVAPSSLMVRSRAPPLESTVLLKVTPVAFRVTSVPSATAPPKDSAPVVVNVAALRLVTLSVVSAPRPASLESEPSASVPTLPLKIAEPPVVSMLRVKLPALPLSRVLLKVMLPTPSSSMAMSAVTRTASLNVADVPLRLIFAPSSVRPLASVVSEDRRLEPPTIPLNEVAPEAFTSSVRSVPSESSVESKVTFTPVRVVSAPRMTASPKLWSPVVSIVAPSIVVFPPASVARLVSAFAPPTAALKSVVPPVLTARACAPLTVLLNVMSPLLLLLSVVPTPRVTASVKV